MRHLLPSFLASVLLLSAGCDRTITEARKTVYVPWEEGLTLVYEDQTVPPAQRFETRIQRRVSASKEGPEGRRVTITYSSLKSNQAFEFLNKDGSWVMMEGNAVLFRMLPEGFPDSVDHWEEKARGISFSVIGRATVQNPDLKLPDDFDRVGIWVEMSFPNGLRQRIFFLPNIGEAEGQVLKDGKWVVVDRLVSRGFTDLPASKTETKTP